ncbi:MarR family winged helix-turn-helix transcriptional regulator [Deinococcus sp.]|uniref:MarR family winged helix-turn-helix transcriptional regulator n=1 Tax=Deinococcus sp. TaxID=47478 RepID=UPI003CC6AE30
MKTRDLIALIQQDWSAAHPGLDTTPVLTFISVNRVSALLERGLETFFAGFDLTPSSYDVLATLRRSAPPEGLSFSRLSELMAITPPAVTKRVDVLEKRGLVGRSADVQDRRALRLRLTAQGYALVERILPLHIANEERLLSGLNDTERLQLRTLLAQLAAQIEAE